MTSTVSVWRWGPWPNWFSNIRQGWTNQGIGDRVKLHKAPKGHRFEQSFMVWSAGGVTSRCGCLFGYGASSTMGSKCLRDGMMEWCGQMSICRWMVFDRNCHGAASLVKGFEAFLSRWLAWRPSPLMFLNRVRAMLWSVSAVNLGLLLQRYYAPNNWGEVVSLAAIPSNLYFVVGYEYGSIRIWSLELGFRLFRRLRCWEGWDLIQALRTHSKKTTELTHLLDIWQECSLGRPTTASSRLWFRRLTLAGWTRSCLHLRATCSGRVAMMAGSASGRPPGMGRATKKKSPEIDVM